MGRRFRCVVEVTIILVGQCCIAGPPAPLGAKPLHNLLDAETAAIQADPGLSLARAPDGMQSVASLRAGNTTGSVLIGPVTIPPSTRMLRFSCALTLIGGTTCDLSARFAAGDRPDETTPVTFSVQAAMIGDVVQDMFIAVPENMDSVTLELRVRGNAGEENGVRLRRPCLAVAHTWPASTTDLDTALLFRQSFSRPDSSADFLQNALSTHPLWSCVLPVAKGKTGPGIRLVNAHDAQMFAVPADWSAGRGHIMFWLRPEWDASDARPTDIVSIRQAGKPRALIRKNHGWSFLFVVWDKEGKTHGASCSLKLLSRDQWSKVDTVWDTGKGIYLFVNGVVLGRKDCTWAAPAAGPAAIRIGEGEHDKPDRAPYVLDELEIRTDFPEELFK